MEKFERLELLLGKEQMAKLQQAKVAVFGLGGVGGYVVEALARSGIGGLLLLDYDRVTASNFNRQIIAVEENSGELKTKAFLKRIATINSDCAVQINSTFILPQQLQQLNFPEYDFIVDAIDTVTTKIAIIEKAKNEDVPLISAMGFGNKLQPEKIRITDISATRICPLAKVMRQELKKRDIKEVTVAYSEELPRQPFEKIINENNKVVVGSFAPVVATAGMMMAAYIIKQLTNEK